MAIKSEIKNASDVDLDSLSFFEPTSPDLTPQFVVEISLNGDDYEANAAFLVRKISSADVLLELPADLAVTIQQETADRKNGDPITVEEMERSKDMLIYHRQAVFMGLVKPQMDESQILQLPNDVVVVLSNAITYAVN